jgi:hypothetical protein
MPRRRARRKQAGLLEQLELLATPEGAGETSTAGDVSRRRTGKTRAGEMLFDGPVGDNREPSESSVRTRAARAKKTRGQVAATAVTGAKRPKRKRRVRWGDLVAVFLVVALSGLAAYNQGLLDRIVAWVAETSAAGPGQAGVGGQQGTQGTPGETIWTGETGGSNAPGEPGKMGESGGPGEPGHSAEPGKPGEYGESDMPGQSGEPGEPGQSGEPSSTGENEPGSGSSLAPMEMALSARALYLTMDTAGTPSRMASIMTYMRANKGLNSLVVDIKDNNGRVPAKPPAHVPARAASYDHLPGLIQILADLDYYMIARIVAFQDPYRAQQEPERAIRRADGSLWRDRDGRLWLNPYDKRNWEFVRDIALWAVDMGFHEIQLDYVRFPDSARGLENSGTVLMPGYEDYETRGDCIAAFLDYMSEALEGKAYLGADIFGFATIASDDMGIGHKWEQLADSVDFMCPMVYPSHYYNPGIYGFQVPEAHPYEVVYKAMTEALERSEGLRAKTRPWLQDFSMRIQYGPEEVSGQIRAAFEHGIETYMLWNPANNYTEGVEYVPEVEVPPEAPDTEVLDSEVPDTEAAGTEAPDAEAAGT